MRTVAKVHAILEHRPINDLLFSDMKSRVERLRTVDVKGFRTASGHGYFSAIDLMRQGFEIFFELSPSRTRYMEARGLIRAAAKDSPAAMSELLEHFGFLCDSILAIYTEERKIESVGPRVIFLEGRPYPQDELTALFKLLGVKAPPSLVRPFRKLVYLDEGRRHYPGPGSVRGERLSYWVSRIKENMPSDGSKVLLKASRSYVVGPGGIAGRLTRLFQERDNLAERLRVEGLEIEVVGETFDLNERFGF